MKYVYHCGKIGNHSSCRWNVRMRSREKCRTVDCLFEFLVDSLVHDVTWRHVGNDNINSRPKHYDDQPPASGLRRRCDKIFHWQFSFRPSSKIWREIIVRQQLATLSDDRPWDKCIFKHFIHSGALWDIFMRPTKEGIWGVLVTVVGH